MSNLKAKLKREGGFTLIEMLIVVAIIAILIAIAIPMVNRALERAREATDAANERAAVGMAMVEVLSENKLGGIAAPATGKVYALYKVVNSKGELVNGSTTDITAGLTAENGGAYGKGTKFKVDSIAENAGKTIVVIYDADSGDFSTKWVAQPSS